MDLCTAGPANKDVGVCMCVAVCCVHCVCYFCIVIALCLSSNKQTVN